MPYLDFQFPSLPVANETALLAAKFPGKAAPKSRCGANEALNFTATVGTLRNLPLQSAFYVCKACPEGAVAAPGSYVCTVRPCGDGI